MINQTVSLHLRIGLGSIALTTYTAISPTPILQGNLHACLLKNWLNQKQLVAEILVELPERDL